MLDLEQYIGVTPNFPKDGISFKDISPLLRDADAFEEAINRMAAIAEQYNPDIFVGAEARGFIFASALAAKMKKGFVMIRKESSLVPGATVKVDIALEYGLASLQVSANSFKPGQRVVVVDDLVATGGTYKGMVELVKKGGGTPVACLSLIALDGLNGEGAVDLPCHHLMLLSDKV